MLAAFNAKNAEYYIKMKNENIQFREWPEDILNKLKEFSVEVLEEMASNDPMSRKVYDSYKKFKNDIYDWTEISERNYKP